MTDGEHQDPRRWLADDLFVLNTIFLVTASSLAIALTSCLWHHIHPELHTNDSKSIFTAFSSFRSSAARMPAQNQQQSVAVSPAPEQKDRKSTRSKERRRRGKDPLKDLFKGGRKSKALLKAIKFVDHENPPPSTDTFSTSTTPENDSASSTSRSQSPEPVGDPSDIDRRASCQPSFDDGGAGDTAYDTPSTLMVSPADISAQHASDACSRADATRPHSAPPGSMTCADIQVNVSSASTIMAHASEDASSSPPVSHTDMCTPQPNDSQAVSTSGNCAKLVRARTRLRLARMESGIRPQRLSFTPSASPDSVVNPFTSIHPNVPGPASPNIPTINHSTDGAGPSTPTNSRGSTPPPRSPFPSEGRGHGDRIAQPLDQSTASAQMQLATMQVALEAAHLREEQLRIEAGQASQERDELRWRWNEDAGAWRRREAELQAQIHHLMQQLQAYVAVASFQAHAQQASNSGFSSPTSPRAHPSPLLQHHPLVSFPLPPPIQTQNSASAPAHVQALLASAPMLPSHPGFAVPAPAPVGGYSGGMSPLLWSGMGLCVPKRDPRHGGRRTPDSSASESSRGRRQRQRAENVQSASDESSLGDWDGIEDGSGDEEPWEEDEEEDEDIFRNNVLADAILKRPESIRGLSKRSGMGRATSGGRGGMHGERMDALKDPADRHGFVPPLVDTPAVRTAPDA